MVALIITIKKHWWDWTNLYRPCHLVFFSVYLSYENKSLLSSLSGWFRFSSFFLDLILICLFHQSSGISDNNICINLFLQCRALFALPIASAELLFKFIHLILIILRHLYNCYKHIMLTIKRFSWVLFDFTRQFYRNLEWVLRILFSCLI